VERTERIVQHRTSSRLSIEIIVVYDVIQCRMPKINKILPSDLSLQFRVEEEKIPLQKFGIFLPDYAGTRARIKYPS
jgi:hypothetical protein